jgi:hypothetical protein
MAKKSSSIEEFTIRAKSILLREDRGEQLHAQWRDKIDAIRSEGMNQKKATVLASEDFLCLTRLLKEYSFNDIYVNRPADARRNGTLLGSTVAFIKPGAVVCEGIEQSHRANLRWAIDQAGAFLRTMQSPGSCPNDAAWWLYRQAIEEPKDFLAKYNQIEGKCDDEQETLRKARHSGERSIAEIDRMLDALENVNEQEDV